MPEEQTVQQLTKIIYSVAAAFARPVIVGVSSLDTVALAHNVIFNGV
jgi:hypothetical protein